jgi:hypothetical protein
MRRWHYHQSYEHPRKSVEILGDAVLAPLPNADFLWEHVPTFGRGSQMNSESGQDPKLSHYVAGLSKDPSVQATVTTRQIQNQQSLVGDPEEG